MMVVTPAGFQYPYIRGQHTMAPLKPIFNPDYIAALSLLETAQALLALVRQSAAEADDPAEWVLLQEGRAPELSDYIYHDRSKRTDKLGIAQDFARYDRVHAFATWLNREVLLVDATKASAVSEFAKSAKDNGFDMAGNMLQHFFKISGEPYEISVDEMLADVPGFRQSIMDYIGFNLGDHFPPSNAEDSVIQGTVVEEVGHHTVYSYSIPWRQVGIGKTAKDDIYGFDGDLPGNLETLEKLSQGEPLDENASQEAYDWYLAVNKIFYYPRVTIVLDNITGNAEVALVIEVRDHYAWYVNEETGALNSIMANLERVGYGQNFPIYGESSPIIGSFNLNEKTTINGHGYYRLNIGGWNEDA